MTDRGEWRDLDNRVAAVTGGGRGTGYVIAERLSQAGATVVVADRDEPAAAAAVERLVADGWSAMTAADGVRVNTVAPQEVPPARATDVAALVHLLAADDARAVTGHCYEVGCGRRRW